LKNESFEPGKGNEEYLKYKPVLTREKRRWSSYLLTEICNQKYEIPTYGFLKEKYQRMNNTIIKTGRRE